MSILASWYTEQANYDKPLVVIVDDVERCSGSVLNDFIVMLRYSSSFLCYRIVTSIQQSIAWPASTLLAQKEPSNS